MPLASLSLVVLAAFVHAAWNLMAKRAAGGGAAFVLAYSGIACLAYLPWVAVLLARGAPTWSPAVGACVLASGLIHLGYNLCLQRGYQVADLSVVYPVARGSAPMLSTLGAVLVLGEALTGPGLLGLLLVVAGIGLIATGGDLAAFRRPGGLGGVRWGGATGGLIAGYTVVDAWGVKALGLPPVLLDWFSTLVRIPVLAAVVLRDPARARAAMRGRWLLALGVGLLSPLSYILVLGALAGGAPLTLVAPAREMSMMAGALLGFLVLREPVGGWRLAGCLVLVGGVALLGAA